MSLHRVYIIDAADDSDVEVELEDDLPVDTLLDVEDQWAQSRNDMRTKLRAANIPRPQWPQSLHWDWGRKGLQLALQQTPGDIRVMGIRRQTVWEAAMVTISGPHNSLSPPDAGSPLVYIDYLEVAPWNWPVKEIGQTRRFKAVGPTLLAFAIAQSEAKGWLGRAGLHALPQATKFYTDHGFAFVKNDPDKQNLPYYELTATEAQKQKSKERR